MRVILLTAALAILSVFAMTPTKMEGEKKMAASTQPAATVKKAKQNVALSSLHSKEQLTRDRADHQHRERKGPADGVRPSALEPTIDAKLATSPSAAERSGPELEEFFEYVAALPGAYDLAWDIRSALEDQPSAFNFKQLTLGEEHNHQLRSDYLEQMIPDPDLRKKWTELMEIVAHAAG